jgi:hypothetical protein
VPVGTTEAYEALRRRVVQPGDGRIEHAAASGILIRCGLARWAQTQVCSTTAWSPPDAHPWSAHSPPEARPAWEVELIQVVAGLILSIRQEGMRA